MQIVEKITLRNKQHVRKGRGLVFQPNRAWNQNPGVRLLRPPSLALLGVGVLAMTLKVDYRSES